jgi:hypothetical protein
LLQCLTISPPGRRKTSPTPSSFRRRTSAASATVWWTAYIPTAAAYDVAEVRRAVGERGLPENPEDPAAILDHAFEVIRAYGRHSGHPRSWGYIIGSAAPVGVLAELIMAGLNNNVASGIAYPAASEIEAQTVRWIAELIGYPTDCGGLFTSGGNVANLIGFLVARRDKAGAALRRDGLLGCGAGRLCAYATEEAHTWLDKAADIAGLGTEAIRRVAADGCQRMDLADLERRIAEDRAAGFAPFLLVGSAGTTSTGAVDPLPERSPAGKACGFMSTARMVPPPCRPAAPHRNWPACGTPTPLPSTATNGSSRPWRPALRWCARATSTAIPSTSAPPIMTSHASETPGGRRTTTTTARRIRAVSAP